MSGLSHRVPKRLLQWKYGLIGGGVALPCTAFSYWQTGSEVSLGAVVFGGLLTGYVLGRSNSDTTRAGIQVGIVGGLPILWAVFDTYVAVTGFTQPEWVTLAQGLFLIAFTVVGFGIAAVVGEVGVRIGTWLADTVESRRNHPTQ
ncbi:DUF5518 domain-containing protein [Halobellus ruber]|uniref:DUF5518 domain-containing protein n=1 Tax=Halobellus ruber TaxID=2761102 RepID=A0A7J9SFN4_9EURY|nr:DUF5518 domain-containing protein [Halobellus ruber]MBB6645528.1 DUF5518 domain-containing protein [Halobellus ruber]